MSDEYIIEAHSKEEAEKLAREKFGSDYLIDDVIITEMEWLIMYSVTLSACGNPDHKENPYSNVVNGIAVEKDIAVADSIEECQRLVRNYIEDNCLGAGNWTGGRVFENGVRVGYISYNGRYWEKGSKYYLE